MVPAKHSGKPWQILSGLVISGLLLGLPGALLPLWDYHVQPAFGVGGNLFIAIGLGALGGTFLARQFDRRLNSLQTLVVGCAFAVTAFLTIGIWGAANPVWAEYLELAFCGIASGFVNTAIFTAITPWYEQNPAGVSLLAGSYFGAGSFSAAVLIGFALKSAAPSRWFLALAFAPVFAGIAYARIPLPPSSPDNATNLGRRRARVREELRSAVAVFFALLLFFQFGSEWALAGWLPVYLIDRLGFSPSTSVTMLALYWFAIVVGRLVVTSLLARVSHGRLLASSAFCALFGCVVLFAATNLFGVVTALVLTGFGFSAIYPLCSEEIGQRFSYYHPAYFNGIFSFALLGAMISPWLLGHLASGATLRIVPLATMLSSCAVFLLILLIWLGQKVSGD